MNAAAIIAVPAALPVRLRLVHILKPGLIQTATDTIKNVMTVMIVIPVLIQALLILTVTVTLLPLQLILPPRVFQSLQGAI